MHRYVIKRILMMIPVLIGVSFLVFLILAVSPGDPTRMILGQQASEEAIVAMREELGLNNNLFVRYFDYMADVLQGDFGVINCLNRRFIGIYNYICVYCVKNGKLSNS